MAQPSKVKYVDDFPELPVDAPAGHPHIIDLKDFNDEKKWDSFTIVDVAVTILYNRNKRSLRAFLDPNRKEYVCRHYYPVLGMLDWAIHRKGKTLTMGHLDEAWPLGWDCAAECRLTDSGDWVPVAFLCADGDRETGEEMMGMFGRIIEYACDPGRKLWKNPEFGNGVVIHTLRCAKPEYIHPYVNGWFKQDSL